MALVFVRFGFRAISCEQINGIDQDFAYALTLASSRLGLLGVHFSKFYNRVMAFDYRHNFVSAQYLVNESMEFDQILHMHWPKPHQDWDCYAPMFANLEQRYGLWLSLRVHFRLISLERMNRIRPNFAYSITLTGSRFGLLRVHFANLQHSYGPWLLWGFRFSSISCERIDDIWSNFA